MRMYDLIYKKRQQDQLTEEEIRWMIQHYVLGDIPDYQMSALCMAICYSGMSEPEIAFLTDAMAKSGEELDLSVLGGNTVDKHSTGGVGDKTTLIVAPMASAMGGIVAKLSGRGLGHTGGTIDKLEAIPGYQTELATDLFLAQAKQHGIVVAGATGNFAPADKKLYALRDVTATVDCIPLIASSIMSKKLAAGAKNIVLDVKCGSGAFMRHFEDARTLAQTMVAIGKRCGRNMCALLTDMNVPLGFAIGNALEVSEAADVLRGKGPKDLREVCIALAAQMISLVRGCTAKELLGEAQAVLDNGMALEKCREWILAQGGDPSYLENPNAFPEASYALEIKAERSAYLGAMDTAEIGEVSCMLGAGRVTTGDCIDPSAGIVLHKKVGDKVTGGEVLATLLTNDKTALPYAKKRFLAALSFDDTAKPQKPHILDIII